MQRTLGITVVHRPKDASVVIEDSVKAYVAAAHKAIETKRTTKDQNLQKRFDKIAAKRKSKEDLIKKLTGDLEKLQAVPIEL
jgi:hypothetical protein